ncbi:nuclear polyadenylated RNA-binding protein 3-like [Nicotiana tomentosiformis]|uniref:nuclear polyadenylated RNA-binding protein 3-like n=1 Tax=Nicotiana tomentosiformis TaxID=4098 RepID=UPI000878305B|nr:glutamic acid-rich protein-like [Nicotiana tomentosiformis]
MFPLLLNYFHDISSLFSIQLFTCSTERNYIFLLCNGILVFIIKNSGLIGNISDLKESHKEKSREYQNPVVSETKTEKDSSVLKASRVQTKAEKVFEKVVEIENQCGEEEEEKEEGIMNQDLVIVGIANENEDEAYNQENNVEIIEEDEEEEELEETLEELHKKCEDFIKRIKKEINMTN